MFDYADERGIHLIIRTARASDMDAVMKLLRQNDLIYENDIERTVVIEEEGKIIGTASLSSRLIKCVAISENDRGRDLTSLLFTAIISEQQKRGQTEFFLFTKPELAERFIQLGFLKIAAGNRAVFMEYKRTGFRDYLHSLHRLAVKAEKVGCIVMHANPFTAGHRFLVEYGAADCNVLHVFVLSDENAFFSRRERFEMVSRGVSDLKNVRVHPAGDYIISPVTFPAYFLKSPGVVAEEYARIDIDLFLGGIAEALYITDRFVGEEPEDELTAMYNVKLQELLPKRGIMLHQVPRLRVGGLPVSASRVRRAVQEKNESELKTILPDSSYQYIISRLMKQEK
jgi:[citrate (pro-3S)-lyase] ligase